MEYDGSLYNPDGIDIYALEDYKLRKGTIVGFPGAQAWDEAKDGPLIEQECDILGACAKEKVRSFQTHILGIITRLKAVRGFCI